MGKRCLSIGINAYCKHPLVNAIPDTKRCVDELQKVDFQCTRCLDADLNKFWNYLSFFLEQIQNSDDFILVNFNGHCEVVAGEPMLVFVDGESSQDGRFKANELIRLVLDSNCSLSATILFLMNCCRVFKGADIDCEELASRCQPGASPKSLRRDVSLFWASALDRPAPDGNVANGSSVFMEAFARYVGKPGQLSEVFKHISEEMQAYSMNNAPMISGTPLFTRKGIRMFQKPWHCTDSASSRDDFFVPFNRKPTMYHYIGQCDDSISQRSAPTSIRCLGQDATSHSPTEQPQLTAPSPEILGQGTGGDVSGLAAVNDAVVNRTNSMEWTAFVHMCCLTVQFLFALLWHVGIAKKQCSSRVIMMPTITSFYWTSFTHRDTSLTASNANPARTSAGSLTWLDIEAFLHDTWYPVAFLLLAAGEVRVEKDWIGAAISVVLTVIWLTMKRYAREVCAGVRACRDEQMSSRIHKTWGLLFAVSVFLAYHCAQSLWTGTDGDLQWVEISFHGFILVFAFVMYVTVAHQCDPAWIGHIGSKLITMYMGVPVFSIVCSIVSSVHRQGSPEASWMVNLSLLAEWTAIYLLAAVCYYRMPSSARVTRDGMAVQ